MKKSKVIVIGAGVAGLSAAIYALKNGFDVEVHEAHGLPGGVCTAWQREGFLIDGCIHWLMDFPELTLMEAEVGLVDVPYRPIDTYAQFLDPQGQPLAIDRDGLALEARLKSRYPEDAAFISGFFRAARRIGALGMPLGKPPALQSWWDRFSFFLFHLPTVIPLMRLLTPMGEYVRQRVRNPELQRILISVFNAEMPASFGAMILGQLFAGRLKGLDLSRVHSLDFARMMEHRLRELGGDIQFKSRITRIAVTAGRVNGVVTQDDQQHPADFVIAAGDLHTTLNELLPSDCDRRPLLDLFDRWQLFKPIMLISFGVENWRWPGAGNSMGMLLKEPVAIGPDRHEQLGVRVIRQSDPHRLVVQAMLETDFDYWNDLGQRDPAAYEAEKRQAATSLLAVLEPLLPGLAAQVRTTDVATPRTFVRFTGVYRGAYEGWNMNREGLLNPPPQTLPAVSGLFFAGQWVSPGGGIQPAIKSGRDAVMLLCHQRGRAFVSS